MVKKINVLIAILGICFIAAPVFAATSEFAGTAGSEITIVATGVTGASALTFSPSAQVSLSGGSVKAGFAILAGHDAVQGKDVGQNYGMASDSSNVFWQAATTEYAAITATNSNAFSNYNRN